LKQKGIAQEVYQIEGGIHRYVEQYPDGFFRGKNYVFDDRIALRVNDDVLSNCSLCTVSCDDYLNCRNALCNKHFICCAGCNAQYSGCCGQKCLDLMTSKGVAERPSRYKASDISC
jgi:predicted sulfurtransferase